MRGQISQEDWKSSFIYTDIAIISVLGIKYFGRMMGNAYQKKKKWLKSISINTQSKF